MRRLAVALVAIAAIGVASGLITASLAPAPRAHAATVRPELRAPRWMQAALARELREVSGQPLRMLGGKRRRHAVIRVAPAVSGTTCYVGVQCSIHPCATFVAPDAVAVAAPEVAGYTSLTPARRAVARCARPAGPSAASPVSAVRVAPSGEMSGRGPGTLGAPAG